MDNRDAAQRFTFNDIDVGTRLFEALVRHAVISGAAPVSYGALLTLARQLHPKDAVLGRAVPVGIGMKLLFVEAFCRERGTPNLACLAVNQATMVPGPGYQGDWTQERRAVAECDWASVAQALPLFEKQVRAAVPARLKPRKEQPADRAWYAYFCSHRAACASVNAQDKQEIINQMMAGLDPETALQRVLAAKADYTEPAA